MQLTNIQKQAYEGVQWLLFGPRQAGRSTVMAFVFLEQASTVELGKWVRVFDHHLTESGNEHLIKLISMHFMQLPMGKTHTLHMKMNHPSIKVVKNES